MRPHGQPFLPLLVPLPAQSVPARLGDCRRLGNPGRIGAQQEGKVLRRLRHPRRARPPRTGWRERARAARSARRLPSSRRLLHLARRSSVERLAAGSRRWTGSAAAAACSMACFQAARHSSSSAASRGTAPSLTATRGSRAAREARNCSLWARISSASAAVGVSARTVLEGGQNRERELDRVARGDFGPLGHGHQGESAPSRVARGDEPPHRGMRSRAPQPCMPAALEHLRHLLARIAPYGALQVADDPPPRRARWPRARAAGACPVPATGSRPIPGACRPTRESRSWLSRWPPSPSSVLL